MSKSLGIFLNNTNSEVKFKINLLNYDSFITNFDHIIIIDINGIYSENLKNVIIDDINNINKSININKYELTNEFIENIEIDLNIEKILFSLKNINFSDFNYITIINDNYLYYKNITSYFNYIRDHDLDFYSISDSSEKKYHYQLYLFSIKSQYINEFINYISQNKNDILAQFNIHTIFNKSNVYIKLAYLENNKNYNIFYNDYLYEYFISSSILPIISINRLYLLKNNYEYIFNIFNTLPKSFDIEIYRLYHDLKGFSDDDLKKHFLNYGQYEYRTYNKLNNYVNYILPVFIREQLKKLDLLNYFDIPDSFNLYYYKNFNKDLFHLNEKELILHWLNYGINENRECYELL
jgi:hypothetical protein